MEISFRPSDYNHIKCNINKYNSFIAIIYLAFHSHPARSSLVFNEQNIKWKLNMSQRITFTITVPMDVNES